MKKIPRLYEKDENGEWVINDIHSWVVKGEGKAHRKWDGCACAIIDGKLYKRRQVSSKKEPPEGFICEEKTRQGRQFGWEIPDEKADPYYFIGYNNLKDKKDGTYELVGVGCQGNAELLDGTYMIPHKDTEIYDDCPTDPEEMREWLKTKDIEGVVWYHPDGRMAKVRKKDFVLPRR